SFEPVYSPAEYLSLDALPEYVPIRGHNLTAVHRGTTPFQFARPSFVNSTIVSVFEAFEYACSNFCAILLGQVKNFGD
ncbi:MAG: hypothetical protein QOE68_329, partial [Thermoanaerobaculia bacterium]|nr:hypothetical protein [Thermoanaerobaculia bacterium]